MTENNNVTDNVQTRTTGEKIAAALKEWGRKQIVGLKRRPQNIAFLVLAATSIYFLFALFPLSQAVNEVNTHADTKATGICMFIVTLVSILVLVSFLNAFPKRKKPLIPFIALVFAMIAGMVACDIVFYVQMNNCLAAAAEQSTTYGYVEAGQPFIIVHIVLLCVSAVVFALLPVYRKFINMIDTSKTVVSATENMKGTLDLEE